MFTSPITHFLPVSPIRRVRLLPAPGRVVVRKGQKVNPTDVVAEAKITAEHILLEVARGLGLPAAKADAYIQQQAGEEVGEGDVIAGPVGIARRVVRAPRAGRVVVAGGGQVLLEVDSRPFELKAGIAGVVSELYEDQGVEIETTGALIQAVWGNGRIDFGLLNVLARSADDVLTPDRLDVSQRGSVVFGGYCKDPEILNSAAEIPLRGLILPSMASALIPLAEKMRYPILVVEGFGKIPMNAAVFKLLTTNARREVALNAENWDRLEGIRPEIVIPLPAPADLPFPKETETFSPGQQVRVLSAQSKGLTGALLALHPGPVVLPSGVRAYAADVRLESGESVVLPLANLEVLA